MKKELELPITLRSLRKDEVSRNSSILERLEKRENANIVNGYTLKSKSEAPTNKNLPFKFYAEINIDNSRLWNLFLELTKLFPSEVALLFGHVDAEVNYGNYTKKDNLLNFLKSYEKELVADTFLNFGIIYHTNEELIEAFIDESKYIKFWGVDTTEFVKIMTTFDLENIEDLEFVDEYPKVREVLRLFDENVTDTPGLIEVFKNEYCCQG